ncbi:hypothetical protein JXM83_00205 [Candidatus Woesearchaeota archaeon]|nr:hypothetical protein [Candidatus Woesearchaeota archaeon]
MIFDKRGFLKTMEVFIAITIVLVFALYVNNNNIVKANEIAVGALDVLARDSEFRSLVFDISNVCYDKGAGTLLVDKIDEIFPEYLDYKVCIFEDVNFKINDLPDVRVYVESYYFSAKYFEYSPRVVKIFYWS